MTTVSKNAAPVKTHRSKAKAEATRRGLLYALPDWLMIIMLFFVPIVDNARILAHFRIPALT